MVPELVQKQKRRRPRTVPSNLHTRIHMKKHQGEALVDAWQALLILLTGSKKVQHHKCTKSMINCSPPVFATRCYWSDVKLLECTCSIRPPEKRSQLSSHRWQAVRKGGGCMWVPFCFDWLRRRRDQSAIPQLDHILHGTETWSPAISGIHHKVRVFGGVYT